MLLFIPFFLPSIAAGFVYQSAPTTMELAALRTAIQQYIASSSNPHPNHLVPELVRLGFHDCVGGCDGCVNTGNDENNGLAAVISGLTNIYTTSFSTTFSWADFIALAATLAAEQGANLQLGPLPHIPTFQFEWGRQDCGATAPAYPTNVLNSFPSALGDHSQTMSFFQNSFNLTARETVALLGAHTLGDLTPANSGFGPGPWARRPDTLNNQYFINLLNLNWVRTLAPNGNQQWTAGTDARLSIMLNADMALRVSFSANQNGVTNCDLQTPCPNAPTFAYVQLYAGDNVQWLDDFALVWNKMLSNGHTMLYTISTSSTLPSSCPSTLCKKPTTDPTSKPTKNPTSFLHTTTTMGDTPTQSTTDIPGGVSTTSSTGDDGGSSSSDSTPSRPRKRSSEGGRKGGRRSRNNRRKKTCCDCVYNAAIELLRQVFTKQDEYVRLSQSASPRLSNQQSFEAFFSSKVKFPYAGTQNATDYLANFVLPNALAFQHVWLRHRGRCPHANYDHISVMTSQLFYVSSPTGFRADSAYCNHTVFFSKGEPVKYGRLAGDGCVSGVF